MHYGIRRETEAAPKGAIENYLVFYNEERIKASLGGLSIKEHRDKLAKCPAFSPKPFLSYSPGIRRNGSKDFSRVNKRWWFAGDNGKG